MNAAIPAMLASKSQNNELTQLQLRRLASIQARQQDITSQSESGFGQRNLHFESWDEKIARQENLHAHEQRLANFYDQFARPDSLTSSSNQTGIQQQIANIPAPSQPILVEVGENKELGVTLSFKPNQTLYYDQASYCATQISKQLMQQIDCNLATTINFTYNGINQITSFSLTLKGLSIPANQYTFFLDDIKKAMFASATETFCTVSQFEIIEKPTLENHAAKNQVKLTSVTGTFFQSGKQPDWKVHPKDTNVRYTIFDNKEQADKFSQHLKTHGLHAYQGSTPTGSQAVSVNLTKSSNG